jgi:AhpD family alkylhydroperoxidase
MEAGDIERIEGMIRDRNEAHRFLFHRSKAYDAFVSLAGEAFSAGALDKKTKELMAVAVSVVIHCEPCMEWHIHEALKAGATEQEILEAMDVAFEMGGGPATVSARFGLKVLEYYRLKGR